MEGLAFNTENGYLEAYARGLKAGILNQTQYLNLTQCETLDGTYSLSHPPTHMYTHLNIPLNICIYIYIYI